MGKTNPFDGLTAADLMSAEPVTIPQRMPMREAAQLLRRAGAHSAPLVDESGKCAGILSADDFLRWAEEAGFCAEECHAASCYYQAAGLLPGNAAAVTCTLPEGSCVLQVMTLTPRGRRVALCGDPHSYSSESQLSGSPSLPDESRRHATAHPMAGPQTPLTELARMMIEVRDQQVHIIDESNRPVGVVRGTDLLALASRGGAEEAEPAPAELVLPCL